MIWQLAFYFLLVDEICCILTLPRNSVTDNSWQPTKTAQLESEWKVASNNPRIFSQVAKSGTLDREGIVNLYKVVDNVS